MAEELDLNSNRKRPRGRPRGTIIPHVKGEWYWNRARYAAARLIAENYSITNKQVSDRVKTSETNVRNWKKIRQFQDHIMEIQALILDAANPVGLGSKAVRVMEKQIRHEALLRTLQERAEAQDYQGVPGGCIEFKGRSIATVVHEIKGIGSGANFISVDEYPTDIATLKELSQLEIDIAKELGQWQDKKVEGPAQMPDFVVEVIKPEPEVNKSLEVKSVSAENVSDVIIDSENVQ